MLSELESSGAGKLNWGKWQWTLIKVSGAYISLTFQGHSPEIQQIFGAASARFCFQSYTVELYPFYVDAWGEHVLTTRSY